jgi:hypothetical protein
MAAPRSQHLGTPAWLLDLDVHGRIYRLATEPLTVRTALDNTALEYSAGLEVRFDAAAGGSPVAVITIVTQDEDFGALLSRGAMPSGWRGTVRLRWPGQTHEAAQVVVEGAVLAPVWDAAGSPVEFELREWYWTDPSLWPPGEAAVGPTTWPVTSSSWESDPAAEGQVYPNVYGQPGISGVTPTRPMSWGSPGLLVEFPASTTTTIVVAGRWVMAVPISSATLLASKLLIAGHEVAAGTVKVGDGSDFTGHSCTVQTGRDARGRVISYVDFSETSTTLASYMRPVEGHEYWVSWTSGGGKLNPQRTAALQGAGEIILDMLRGSVDRRVDVGRQEAQRAFLDSFRLDFYVNESVDPEVFIDRNLVPILPIVRRVSHEGVYYQALRYDARPEQAVMALVAGENCTRETGRGLRLTDEADVRNDLTLRYAREGQDAWYLTLRLQGEPSTKDTDRVATISHLYAAVSAQVFGARPWESSTDVIARKASAALVLQHLVLRYGLPHTPASYTGDAADLEQIERGDVVTILDDEVGLLGRVALVDDMAWDEGLTRITLDLIILADYAAWIRS